MTEEEEREAAAVRVGDDDDDDELYDLLGIDDFDEGNTRREDAVAWPHDFPVFVRDSEAMYRLAPWPDIPPRALAMALTMRHERMMHAIRPSELENQAWLGEKRRTQARNLSAVLANRDAVVSWATGLVLMAALSRRRRAVPVLTWLVALMRELLALRNFHGAFAVLDGVQTSSVRRVHPLWTWVGDECRAHVDAAAELLDQAGSHNRLHSLIEMARQARRPYVPHLSATLSALCAVASDTAQTVAEVKARGDALISDLFEHRRVAYWFGEMALFARRQRRRHQRGAFCDGRPALGTRLGRHCHPVALGVRDQRLGRVEPHFPSTVFGRLYLAGRGRHRCRCRHLGPLSRGGRERGGPVVAVFVCLY